MTKRHIIIALAVMMTLFASCKKDEAEVIPRRKMAEIYAEMLVTDQWITETPGVRRIADTSLVYEPILEKYGYDSADYRKSIDKYMDDPERFSRIFRTTVEILEERIEELKKEQDRLLALSRLPKIEVSHKLEEYAPYLMRSTYLHSYDSLYLELDTVAKIYSLKYKETADTLYEGPRMTVRDKIVPADSLAVKDSLALKDSLAAEDSMMKKESPVMKDIMHNPLRTIKRDVSRTDTMKVRRKDIRRPDFKAK